MKSSLIKRDLIEGVGLPEKITADGLVKFVRGLWRAARRSPGGAPRLFCMVVEDRQWCDRALSGLAPPYYTGGASTMLGSLAICESILANEEHKGDRIDPRVKHALACLRSILAESQGRGGAS